MIRNSLVQNLARARRIKGERIYQPRAGSRDQTNCGEKNLLVLSGCRLVTSGT